VVLHEYLERLTISQVELAGYIGISPSKLSMVIHGRRGITPELAWGLSMALGTTPMFWMKLQALWDLEQCKPSVQLQPLRPPTQPDSQLGRVQQGLYLRRQAASLPLPQPFTMPAGSNGQAQQSAE
jgi:addiction module HigA family antidote